MKHASHNVAVVVQEAWARSPDRPALIHDGRATRYAELEQLVDAWVALLGRYGVGPDRCALLWLPNTPAFVAAFFATLRLGGCVAPLGSLLKPREVRQRLELARPIVLVTTPTLAGDLGQVATAVLAVTSSGAELAPAPRITAASRAPDDVAALMFTSGTTGTAKAAELTHAGLDWNSRALAEGFGLNEADIQLAVAPLSHVLGMTGVMNATLRTGGALALMERFDAAAALSSMSQLGITGLMGAPTMFKALVREARARGAASRLRFAHGGGAPFPAQLAESVTEMFGCVVREGYGMSEVGGGITLTPIEHEAKARSVGTALVGSSVRVVDLATRRPLGSGEHGEVQVRSPSVMRGYRGDEAGTRAVLDVDGWLSTGDVGYLDADGYLFLIDRNKELIIRSGYNVYPREVEEVLMTCPDVVEAAVLGVPDEEHGEEVVALVVPGRADLDPEAVKAFGRERLAAYKYPRYVLVVDALPRSPTGKVLKRDIERVELMARLRLLGWGCP